MNTQSNAMPESLSSRSRFTALRSRRARPMYWSVRRELWENRSIYIAPLAAAGLVLFGFLISCDCRPGECADGSTPRTQRRARSHTSTTMAAGLIMVDRVHRRECSILSTRCTGERRDRSILFWKSLPVSDLTTVLAKASIPLLVLPLLSFALILATQLIMGALSSLVLLGSGLPVATLWTTLSQSLLMLFYHLVTVHVFWHAPIYAWFLLVSGWARRATFLWAALPPLAIGVFEKIVFHTWHFAAWLGYRLAGPEDFRSAGEHMSHPMAHDLGVFLTTPGLWMGLIVAALFLTAAVRLRRYREPI